MLPPALPSHRPHVRLRIKPLRKQVEIGSNRKLVTDTVVFFICIVLALGAFVAAYGAVH